MNYSESSHRERWLFTAAQLVRTLRIALVADQQQMERELRKCAELAVGYTERAPGNKYFDNFQGDRLIDPVICWIPLPVM